MRNNDRDAVLRHAAKLLAAVADGIIRSSITVRISTEDGSSSITLKSRPGQYTAADTDHLTSRQRTILAAYDSAQADTLSTNEICRETGYRNNSTMRAALSEMVQAGLLDATDDGYQIVR